MEKIKDKLEKLQKAVITVFNSWPSVPNWCRMCNLLSEYFGLAAQEENADAGRSEIVRKALGYLERKPKRILHGQCVDTEEWNNIVYYNEKECKKMSLAFNNMCRHIEEWAMFLELDEQLEDGCLSLGGVLCRNAKSVEADSLFKRCTCGMMFRGAMIRQLHNGCSIDVQVPPEDKDYLPEPEATEDDERRRREDERDRKTDNFHNKVIHGLNILTSEAMADSPAKKRVGTKGEIAQENEVLRRVNLNGGRALRGFVAQVLREAAWQLPDGHPNTERGRMKCYNRVYALLHPSRRVKEAKRSDRGSRGASGSRSSSCSSGASGARSSSCSSNSIDSSRKEPK